MSSENDTRLGEQSCRRVVTDDQAVNLYGIVRVSRYVHLVAQVIHDFLDTSLNDLDCTLETWTAK